MKIIAHEHSIGGRVEDNRPEFSAIHYGKADAAIIGLESDSPLIQSSLRDSGIRLLSVTRAEALTRFFPSLVRLLLPAR